MRITMFLLAFAILLTSPLAFADGGNDESASNAHDEVGYSSPELQPGESISHTITEEGTFDYHCHPHPWMLAQLRVLPSNGTPMTHVINITEPTDQPFENWTFSPKVMDVRLGDTVTWVNVGTVMHRVTQTVGEHIAHVGTVGESEADSHDDDGDAHPENGPSKVWWLLVAGLGVGLVYMWTKGNRKA